LISERQFYVPVKEYTEEDIGLEAEATPSRHEPKRIHFGCRATTAVV
jgi:hypothetical protein